MNIAHSLENSERTEDVIINENITFEGLLLSQDTLDGLKKCGFLKPSPIQLRAIPLGKCGFDLILEAKSGTGKTAVFGIIALEMINLQIGCQVLIVAPTREIASQIAQVLTAIGSSKSGLKVDVVMGGTDLKDDMKRLNENKFQILTGSPGRMKHLIKENVFSTDSIRLIVLDEADKLIDESFKKDIDYIFSKLPHRKQVIVSSATYSPQITDFLSCYMRSPSHVRPNSSSVLLGISQYSSIVPLHHNTVRQKTLVFNELLKLLSNISFKQSLIFTNHQIVAKNLCKSLTENGWPARYLSGMQTQSERLDSLRALQTFSCRILVATDLAARGIDAANVDLVINYDPPCDLPTYLHRIGRAGRYGSKGFAVTILPAGKEEENFQRLLKNIVTPNDINGFNVSNAAHSNENERNYTHVQKSKCGILNVMVSSQTEGLVIESSDDILMSCDQFSTEDKLCSLETFDSLIDSLDECSGTSNFPKSDLSITQMDYSVSNFLHSNNIDLKNEQNRSQVLESGIRDEQNDEPEQEDDFLRGIQNRCTLNRNAKIEKYSDKSKRRKTNSNVENLLRKIEKKDELEKDLILRTETPNSKLQRGKQNYHHESLLKMGCEKKTINHVRHFDFADYQNLKLQLSFIMQQIQASVYINTLSELNK